MSLKGRSAADEAGNTLELSETRPFLLRAYDALATPLFLHEGAPVDIEQAIEDENGTLVVAYWLPNRELKLAELRGSRRVVRRSLKTGIACTARDCNAAVSGTRPRPGTVLVIVTNTSWDCTPSCATTLEVALWTLTARGFLFTGAIPAGRAPTDPRERERLMSSYWVNVDGGSDLALLVGMHPRPRETSKAWLFTFDPQHHRFTLDTRKLGASPDDRVIPPGSVQFGIW
jgi:hypothetical protein